MRYNKKEFNKAVLYYKKELKKTQIKNVFIWGNYNKRAFFSVAPLSRAAADLKIDMNVSFGHNSKSYEILFDVWKVYEDYKKGLQNKKTQALKALLKHIKIKGFEKYFKRPDLIIEANAKQFSNNIRYPYW